MSVRSSLALLLALLLSVLSLGVRPGQAVPQEGPIFSSHSDLVVLNVAVTTRDGEYVAGLDRDAFTVFEDGRPQTIDLFSSTDAPVTVGLIIDDSGSMAPMRSLVSVAAGSFAATSNPQDEIFALVFSDSVRAVLPRGTPFTSDPAVLRTSMSNAITAVGRTAMYDALVDGLDYLMTGNNQRKVLVLVSDGGDNASHTTFDDVLQLTQASNTVIYGIALPDPFDGDGRPGEVKRLATATGGKAYQPKETTTVDKVLREVARDIRSMYTIGYAPTNTGAAGRFRKIRVTAAAPAYRDLRVRTREGYVVEEP